MKIIRWKYLIATALAVLVLVVAAWAYLFLQDNQSQDDIETFEPATGLVELYDSVDKWDNPSDLDLYLSAQVEHPEVPPRVKSEAYILKISIANQSSQSLDGGLSTKLKYALQAYEFYPSGNTASTVGSLYEQLDRTEDAIVYYRLALEKETAEEVDFNNGSASGYYETKIELLEGKLE